MQQYTRRERLWYAHEGGGEFEFGDSHVYETVEVKGENDNV